MLVLLWPPNFHHHRGWLPPNQHRHRGVLQCTRRSFWTLFPKDCPSLPQSSHSHLNAASFDPAWTHGESGVGDTTRLPRTSAFPLQTTGHPDSRDSLGTVLSETVATVSLSASLRLSTLALTLTIFATAIGTAWYVQKSPPLTELQIPATLRTLHHVAKICTYQLCKRQSANTYVLIGRYRLSAKRPIIGRYRLSADYRYIPNQCAHNGQPSTWLLGQPAVSVNNCQLKEVLYSCHPLSMTSMSVMLENGIHSAKD